MEVTDYGMKSPCIMGILNITPDSFSDGGKYLHLENALAHAAQLERDGADIIDIGGESSRPGADRVSPEEELQRVLPVIDAIRKNSTIPLSIDTYKAQVAEEALDRGVNWVNDISGLRLDTRMPEIIKKWNCPVILMHMLGSPKTMQVDPNYRDVVAEIDAFFSERIRFCRDRGIHKIILDPGIGFGKRLQDNLAVLKQLDYFKRHTYPLAIGTSRKSFIGTITGQAVENRLAGTLATIVWSVLQGVSIIRTHEVAEARDAIKIITDITGSRAN